jgi:hypothetical protein
MSQSLRSRAAAECVREPDEYHPARREAETAALMLSAARSMPLLLLFDCRLAQAVRGQGQYEVTGDRPFAQVD